MRFRGDALLWYCSSCARRLTPAFSFREKGNHLKKRLKDKTPEMGYFLIITPNRNVFSFHCMAMQSPIPMCLALHTNISEILCQYFGGLACELHLGPYLNNCRHYEHFEGHSFWFASPRAAGLLFLPHSVNKAIIVEFQSLFLTDDCAQLGYRKGGAGAAKTKARRIAWAPGTVE